MLTTPQPSTPKSEARLTVRFITRKWGPTVGGMETYAQLLAETLREKCDLRLSVLPGRTAEQAPSPLQLLWFGLCESLRLLMVRRPDGVVHVADMASWPIAFAARLRSRRWRIVLSAHGTDVSYPNRGGSRGRLYGAYLRLGAKLLAGAIVIANSETTARQTRSFGFADMAIVTLGTTATAKRRAQVDPTGEILFAGRLIPRKGCAWFIRHVLPLLPQELTLAVAGPASDEDERQALRHPRVRHLGAVDPAQMPALYAAALCVVVPNVEVQNGEFEGFGLVAPEAAVAGGVVLASALGGLKDAVIDGETGFLLPAGDAQAWAAKVCDVFSWTAAVRDAFTRRAPSVASQKFSWARAADETLVVYSSRQARRAPTLDLDARA